MLLKDSNILKKYYRLAKVGSVMPGEDGRIRRVKLLYKNPGSSKFSETERCIQNIVVIVPNDWKEEDVEAAVLQDLQVNKL